MLHLRSLVAQEKVTFSVGVLLSDHVHKASRQSCLLGVTTNLEDVDAVPPIHAQALLGGWQLVKCVSDHVWQLGGRVLEDTLTVFVASGDRKLAADTNTNAESGPAGTKSGWTNRLVVRIVCIILIIMGTRHISKKLLFC